MQERRFFSPIVSTRTPRKWSHSAPDGQHTSCLPISIFHLFFRVNPRFWGTVASGIRPSRNLASKELTMKLIQTLSQDIGYLSPLVSEHPQLSNCQMFTSHRLIDFPFQLYFSLTCLAPAELMGQCYSHITKLPFKEL